MCEGLGSQGQGASLLLGKRVSSVKEEAMSESAPEYGALGSGQTRSGRLFPGPQEPEGVCERREEPGVCVAG